MNNDLSIIIPVYNGELYLKECLDSILNTNQRDKFEIIVINDGSTDRTAEILEQYASKKNIFIFNNENYGVSFSRNYGIEKSTGKYIMFVDADDVLMNNWDEKIFPYLDSNDDYIIFNNRIVKEDRNSIIKYIIGANKEKICIAGPFSKLYKTKFLKTNNILFKDDLINGEDMIFNVEVALKSQNYKLVRASFYRYRVYVGSSTKSFNKQILKTDNLFQYYLDSLSKHISDERTSIEIKNYSKLNGILTFVDRLSYIKSYAQAKEFYSYIEIPPYKQFLNIKCGYINKFNRMLVILCKKKQYRIIYWILKLKHTLINLVNKKNLFREI